MKGLIAAICFALAAWLAADTFGAQWQPHWQRKAQQAPSGSVSMRARDWDFRFSPGVPKHPTAINSESWEFWFPTSSSPWGKSTVNYLTTPYGAPLAGQIAMTLQIVTTGAPQFDYGFGASNPCTTPASVRFYIERGDVGFNTEFSRWWSNPISHQLAAGSTTITAPFDPAQWSSVFGKSGTQAPGEFSLALQNVRYVGMTFGGGCFFGHGVSVSNGTAKMIVTNFGVGQ